MLPADVGLRIRSFIGRRALKGPLKMDILFESMIRGATSKEINDLLSSINIAIAKRSCIESLKLIRLIVQRIYHPVDHRVRDRARITLDDGTTVRVPVVTWLQSPLMRLPLIGRHLRAATVPRAER